MAFTEQRGGGEEAAVNQGVGAGDGSGLGFRSAIGKPSVLFFIVT